MTPRAFWLRVAVTLAVWAGGVALVTCSRVSHFPPCTTDTECETEQRHEPHH